MPLVTTTEMFKKAYHGGYAIGAFNVNNMEIVQGITEAAQELNAPLILQVSKGARKYANHTYLMKLVEAAVINTGLPIALHLDHGDSFELCKSCIDGGFTSVMIDASSKPFEENIALTRQVVDMRMIMASLLRPSSVLSPASKTKSMFPQKTALIPGRKMYRNLSSVLAATLLQSRLALLMVHTSLSLARIRNSDSTSLKKLRSVCPSSRSFFTVLLPFRRNL